MENDKLEEFTEIKNKIDDLSQKIDRVEEKVIEARKEAEKAKTTASNARKVADDSNGSTWLFGLLIVAILAFSTNPSFREHHNFLDDKGSYVEKYRARKAYTSYYLFSVIDSLGGDVEGKMITFGIFGNVFEINKP